MLLWLFDDDIEAIVDVEFVLVVFAALRNLGKTILSAICAKSVSDRP